jgi:hypothetical protein
MYLLTVYQNSPKLKIHVRNLAHHPSVYCFGIGMILLQFHPLICKTEKGGKKSPAIKIINRYSQGEITWLESKELNRGAGVTRIFQLISLFDLDRTGQEGSAGLKLCMVKSKVQISADFNERHKNLHTHEINKVIYP